MTTLVSVDNLGLAPSPYVSRKAFKALSSSGFLPWIALQGSSSNAVKKRQIEQGHFALFTQKDDFTDLGVSVKALVLDVRHKAVAFKKKLTVYDPDSEEFKEIERLSEHKDPAVRQGNAAGNEFLLYLPDNGAYATLHMANKTARREVDKLGAMIGNAIRLESALLDNGENSWWGMRVLACSDPITVPALDEIKEQVAKFRPKVSSENVAEGEEAPATSTRPR
jgi:hypothetical protein